MKFLIPAITLLFACGCSSTPASKVATPVRSAGPDAATVIFFRAKCPPVAVKGALFIDGVKCCDVGVRRYTIARVAPGKHQLKYAFPFWAGTPSKTLGIEVGRKETRYFYYTTDMNVLIGAPVPTTTITPEVVAIGEEAGRRLLGEFVPEVQSNQPSVPTASGATPPAPPPQLR